MPVQNVPAVQIVVNGESRSVPGGTTVLSRLTSLDLEPERLAIELDSNILKRDRWSETALEGGEQLEIVQFVGGG